MAREMGEPLMGAHSWDTDWKPQYKKRCVWCWKLRHGTSFREVSPVKRLEVCLDCESKDPPAAREITKSEAIRLRRAMRQSLMS